MDKNKKIHETKISGFENLFDVYKLDESFYRAYKASHNNEQVRDAIVSEMNQLASYNEFHVMAKNENILRAGSSDKKHYVMDYANLKDMSIGSYNRVLDKLIYAIKDNTSDNFEIIELKNNAYKDCTTAKAKRRVDAKIISVINESNLDEKEKKAVKSALIDNILSLSTIDAEVILGSVNGSYKSSFKETEIFKNLSNAYDKIKKLDREKAFEFDTIDETAKNIKELNEAVVEFKYNLADINNLPAGEKEQRKILRSNVVKKQKQKIKEYTDQMVKSYDELCAKTDKDTADHIIESCLVLNRVNKKLSSPNYNFSELTARGALYLDEVVSTAENQSTMLTQIMGAFADTRFKNRVFELRKKVNNKELNYKVPDRYFRNALMIDKYLNKSSLINNVTINENKRFSEKCFFNESISDAYLGAYALINSDSEKYPKVKEEIKTAFLKAKLDRINGIFEVMYQHIEEATDGMESAKKEKYQALTIEYISKYNDILVKSIKDIYADKAKLTTTEKSSLEAIDRLLNKQGEFSQLSIKENLVYSLSACDAIIYNMDKEDFSKFLPALTTNLSELESVTVKYDEFTNIKEYTDAMILAFRDIARPLSTENKYSYYNKELISNMYKMFEKLDKEEQEEAVSRIHNFFQKAWDAPKNEQEVERRYYSEKADANNIAATQPQMTLEQNNQSADQKLLTYTETSNEDNHAEAPKQKVPPIMRFYPSAKEDIQELNGITRKYSNNDEYMKDFHRTVWGCGVLFFGICAVVMLALGGFALASFSAAALCGLGCAWKYRSYVNARSNEDMQKAQAIAKKYNLKFRKSRFLRYPDATCARLARKIKKINRKNDILNDLVDPTGEYRKQLAEQEANKGKKEKDKENSNESQKVQPKQEKEISENKQQSSETNGNDIEAEVNKEKKNNDEKQDEIVKSEPSDAEKEDKKENQEKDSEPQDGQSEAPKQEEKEEPKKEDSVEQENKEIPKLDDNRQEEFLTKQEPIQIDTKVENTLQIEDGGRKRIID